MQVLKIRCPLRSLLTIQFYVSVVIVQEKRKRSLEREMTLLAEHLPQEIYLVIWIKEILLPVNQ